MTKKPDAEPDTGKSANGSAPEANVIDLRAARRSQAARQRALQGIVPETADQIRRRMIQNISAGILVVVLVAGGAWLVVRLRDSLKLEACLESGRRSCARIDTTQLPKSQ